MYVTLGLSSSMDRLQTPQSNRKSPTFTLSIPDPLPTATMSSMEALTQETADVETELKAFDIKIPTTNQKVGDRNHGGFG